MIVVVVACAPPASHESPELAARGDAWEQNINAGDLDGLVALYTDDARLLPPNAEMAQGHDAVRASFSGMIDAGLTASLTTVEAVVAGDIGYRIGTYSLEAPDGSMVDSGKFIDTWRQVGGEWMISTDIWNSDLPAGGPTGTTLAIAHQVGDPERWLAAWQGPDSRRALFAEHGVAQVRVFQSPENPNLTGLLVDVTDMEAFHTFLDSEAGRAAAAEDTVDFDTIQFLSEVD
jgi:ketosteroid isomerase-like protein